MKRIAIGFLVALLVSLLLVGVAAAEWPPYYYAGWRDCNLPGCIPPYSYGMYHDYGRWAPSNYYNYNYTYNNYNYTYNNYNYTYGYYPTYYYPYPYYPYYPVVYGGHTTPGGW